MELTVTVNLVGKIRQLSLSETLYIISNGAIEHVTQRINYI